MVKVSVVMPVYNVEQYLKKCLDSITNQTLKDIEIICIDDGSTDTSLEILKDYALKDNRIKILSQKNEGAATSRNKGIDLASGEYISFVDSDDWLELDAFEKLYNHAEEMDSEMVLFNAREIYKNKIKKRIYINDNKTDFNSFTFDYNYKKRLVLNGMFVIWSKLYKSSFLKSNKIKCSNYKIFNDVQFHIKSMILAKNISYFPEVLYNYNKLNESSIQTLNSDVNKRLVLFKIFGEIKEFIINLNLWDEFELEFYEFFIRESQVNLNKTSKNFKEEFYQLMRKEFLKMRISPENLKELPLKWNRYYIQIVNNESLHQFNQFKRYTGDFDFIYKHKIQDEIDEFNEIGINLKDRAEEIIVSLTSIPERMYDIHFCLYSLFTQSFKPDKIILWLAESQFPNKEEDIPENVLNFKKNGLTIRWCDDLRSFKKLIPAIEQYPDSYIVTADDDIYYPKDWLKNMWEAYKKYPNTIISSRARRIRFYPDLSLRNYVEWDFEYETSSSYINFPNCGGGALFFPNSLSGAVFDKNKFMELCPNSDDIWFWAMAVLNKTKITSIGSPLKDLKYINILREINVIDEKTLWQKNRKGINDTAMDNILTHFSQINEIIKFEE